MWERCRFCGTSAARALVLAEGEHACPACAGSPLCDRCGHPRGLHTGVFREAGRTCRHVWSEFQTGFRFACDCDGFQPVTGELRNASFAEHEPADRLPPLRVAPQRE